MADPRDLLTKAKAYIALAESVEPVTLAAAHQVVMAFRQLSEAEAEDIADLLTGNPIADRARLETAAAAGAVNATIDWANVPTVAFKLARQLLELATIGAALL